MNNILDSIIFLTKEIENIEFESGYAHGDILLSESNIEEIAKIEHEYLIEVHISGSSIEISNLNSHKNSTAKIQIKIGDVSNFFNTTEDFISGNKYECKLKDFYIKDIDYRELKDNNSVIEQYKQNLKIIDFLSSIAESTKKNELFFYKTGKGVNFKVEYNLENLKALNLIISDEFKSQILDSFNGKDKKQLFINELIVFLDKNGCSYVKLIENWDTLVSNYEKSYSLFVSGFSFEKIKTSSNEHFQKLVDRIYESIGKVSNYIFGIPIGYILLINNFDFSGNYCFKNFALLLLGLIFFLLIWFVLFKNIDESIISIEKDINDFLDKIHNIKELEEIHNKLEGIKSGELKKQRFKLNFVKGITIVIFSIIIITYLFIFFDICIFM